MVLVLLCVLYPHPHFAPLVGVNKKINNHFAHAHDIRAGVNTLMRNTNMNAIKNVNGHSRLRYDMKKSNWERIILYENWRID